jgi:uncharacterized protein
MLKMAEHALTALTDLQADIDLRVRNIRDEHVDWPCHRGCDNCCRRLADVPQLTALEWDWLQAGLANLPVEQLQEIRQNMADLARQPARPIICPLLERSTGACRVYAYRPVACRTYGFYVQRDQGLYCTDIEARVARGDWAEVVWGNHDVIDRRLKGMGDTQALTRWFTHFDEAIRPLDRQTGD